ncbi:hypothetical protein [Campylobacter gastrosuis]|uniref:Integral membrane protein n=1 Tax=Campylobacter gastrosuis TaxID=2974576 RepID=A0ABT7HNW0_9BACT|nr:hypothetical protein [Campylobacter gastrosuis]MDL0088509.1 hypothetical protein [Campylobacter gastrosuis]
MINGFIFIGVILALFAFAILAPIIRNNWVLGYEAESITQPFLMIAIFSILTFFIYYLESKDKVVREYCQREYKSEICSAIKYSHTFNSDVLSFSQIIEMDIKNDEFKEKNMMAAENARAERKKEMQELENKVKAMKVE